MFRAHIMRGDRNAAEETESHRRVAERVMPRRTHGAEAAARPGAERAVDAVENGARCGGRSIPRAFTRDGVGIEPAAALLGESPNLADVRGIMRERELVLRCMPRLDVLDPLK